MILSWNNIRYSKENSRNMDSMYELIRLPYPPKPTLCKLTSAYYKNAPMQLPTLFLIACDSKNCQKRIYSSSILYNR